MKTMVLEAPGVVALRELPMPVPAPGGALVRITHSGICGTDSKIFTGAIPARLPVVMGDEIVGEIVEGTAADGSGPVGALDNALRKALLGFYPELETVRLTDYKVRVVDQGVGTGAVVRVLIESTDGQRTWTSVGSSENIIEASWMALSDSLEWWLSRHED